MDPLTLAAGAASAWMWEQFGKEIIARLGGTAAEQWGSFKSKRAWQDAADNYRNSLRRQFSTIRILGKSEPVDLEGIFTDVYILDEITARKRFDIEALKQQYLLRSGETDDTEEMEKNRENAFDVIKYGQNLFILGKPGAGKTTFLKHVVLSCINGRIDKVPIFISLKEWSDSSMVTIEDFIVRHFDICGFPNARHFIDYVLQTGRAIVLLDGLDEVNETDGKRFELTGLIQNFSKQYFLTQCLITCRIAASEYAFEQFHDVEVADFRNDQIVSFVGKWFNENNIKKDRFLEEFNDSNNISLRELGKRPLLLALLCLAFDANMSFPQRRSELYEDALDAMIRRWDSARNIRRDAVYRSLSLRHKQGMFAHIAAATFQTGQYFIPQGELEARIAEYVNNLPAIRDESEIDSRVLLKSIESQHGIFVECARNIYSFSHLTVHEFYAAKYIADNEARRTTKKLIDNYLTDTRWREVILLTSSLLDEADDYLCHMADVIDRILADHPRFVNLLRKVDRRSKEINKYQHKPWLIRGCYLAMLSGMSVMLSRDIPYSNKKTGTINFGFILNSLLIKHSRQNNFYEEFNSAIIQLYAPFHQPLSQPKEMIVDFLLISVFVAISQITSEKHFTKSQISKLIRYLKRVRAYIKANRLEENYHAFIGMSISVADIDETYFREFAYNLQFIFPELHDISTFVADETFNGETNQYIKSTALLVECLNVAGFVTQRLAIEKRLFIF